MAKKTKRNVQKHGTYLSERKYINSARWSEMLNETYARSPMEASSRMLRECLSLVGSKFLKEFDITKFWTFEAFSNHWLHEGGAMYEEFLRASVKRVKFEDPRFSKASNPEKYDLLINHNRVLLESMWVDANCRRIVANASDLEHIKVRRWNTDNLNKLGDSAIEFVRPDGLYLRPIVQFTKYDDGATLPDGSHHDFFTISIECADHIRCNIYVLESMPDKLLVPIDALGPNFHKTDIPTVCINKRMTYACLELNCDLLDDKTKRFLFSIMECADQYATVVAKKKTRANTSYTNRSTSAKKGSSGSSVRSLIRYIYLGDEALEPSEYRKEYVKRSRPRCHERRGTWCTSKTGKVYWRKGSMVNKDLSKVVYKMDAPSDK